MVVKAGRILNLSFPFEDFFYYLDFSNNSIKESVSLEPPAMTSFLSVLTFLKASTRYRIDAFLLLSFV